MRNINKIRDHIEAAVEVSRDSGVPVLLLANPGLAKSTIVYHWARRHGCHLETLIGSRFSQEEILGFQVRLEEGPERQSRLELLEPRWYRNILEAESRGVPSVLFLDELSTAAENVQGSLLQLIFERTIGQGKELPPSTLVIAAANYKQNIPYQFNMMAPILNRFCIVNLQYESNESFLNEFLQDEEEWGAELPVYEGREITDQEKRNLRGGLKTLFRTLFVSFEEEQTGQGRLYTMDINNQNYTSVYDGGAGPVYNFITGRTVSYLYRITLSFLRKGFTLENQGRVMINMVRGLAGLGTNTFTEKQRQEYLHRLETLYTALYAALSGGERPLEQPETSLDFSGKGVGDAVQEWILFHESSFAPGYPHLDALARHIKAAYGTAERDIESLRQRVTYNRNEGFAFSNDLQRVAYLIRFLEEDPLALEGAEHRPGGAALGGETPLQTLREIRDAYEPLQREILGSIPGFT
ncbi:MAG: AAA family ATPase [Treponema sp.]|jgi:hypothetical protein|nr:AAA family ATPase [Treponema sp.]